MPDSITKEKRSEIMSRIKGSGTTLENTFRKSLWSRGFRYRKNVKKLKGTPDIYFARSKTVVFLDSCFWHGCPWHCRMPKSNVEYWNAKIVRNKKRDKEVSKYYKENGYMIVRIWEHEIKKDLVQAIKKVTIAIHSQ